MPKKQSLGNIDLSSLNELADQYPKAHSEEVKKNKKSADANLTIKIPDYVLKEIKIKSAVEGKTQRQIILEGLVALGLKVNNEDIVDRRKN